MANFQDSGNNDFSRCKGWRCFQDSKKVHITGEFPGQACFNIIILACKIPNERKPRQISTYWTCEPIVYRMELKFERISRGVEEEYMVILWDSFFFFLISPLKYNICPGTCTNWQCLAEFTKTCLFKYTETFTTQNENFSDNNSDIFHISASYFCSKHGLWVLVRTASARRF